ncbi:hypothetical protein Golax_025594, partial [Gossypium laxum]|nr:hypothetical protein [Gossypium laxum]
FASVGLLALRSELKSLDKTVAITGSLFFRWGTTTDLFSEKNLKAWSGYNQVAIMEKELADLSLGEEEEEGVQFELEGQPQTSIYDLCLVGRCLTASVVDLERVMSGIPWTFNNHLILFHKLKVGEDPTSIPLIYSDFWVHVHDLPSGYSSDQVAKQLGNFVAKLMRVVVTPRMWIREEPIERNFGNVLSNGRKEQNKMGTDDIVSHQNRGLITQTWGINLEGS